MMPNAKLVDITSEQWSMVNITRSENNIHNARPLDAQITVGNGEKVKVKMQGNLFLQGATTGR
jgi:hypothetical protein